jgi:hypothetical protein
MRVAALVLLLLSAAAAPQHAAAQATFPDTPAGRRAAGWLRAFDARSLDSLRVFLATAAPDPPEGQFLLRPDSGILGFREETGGFDFRRVEESTPTKLGVLVQERGSDQIARLDIEVQAAEPHYIVAMSFRPVPRPADLAIPRLADSALVAELRSRLEREAAAGRFAGGVLVARDGRTLFEGAYGLADRERNVANTIDTRFRIGSMNKMFTAVATLQLVQQ